MRFSGLFPVVAVLLVGCAVDSSELKLEVRIDFSQVPELYSIDVEWDRLALQRDDEDLGPNPPKGHGVLLDSTWLELPALAPWQRFVRSSDAHQALYDGRVETGGMGRVWPVALSLKAATASGRELPIHSILEPITVKFPLLRGTRTTLRVELMVLRSLGAAAGSYALYTKDAYWSEGASGDASVRAVW